MQIEYSRELGPGKDLFKTQNAQNVSNPTPFNGTTNKSLWLCVWRKKCVESGDIEYSISKNIHPERRLGYVFCPQNFPPFHVVAG